MRSLLARRAGTVLDRGAIIGLYAPGRTPIKGSMPTLPVRAGRALTIQPGQATGRSARGCRGRRPCRGERAVWGVGGRTPPLVLAAASGAEGLGPLRPPRGDPARDGLDDEDGRAGSRRRDEPARAARGATSSSSSFTVNAARMPAGGFGRGAAAGVGPRGPAVEAEAGVGPAGLRDRPAAAVDTLEAGPGLALERPRRARGAGAAAEVEDAAGRAAGRGPRTISRTSRKCRGP